MYIRCAKCQHKLPQEKDRSGLMLGIAGLAGSAAIASSVFHLASPVLTWASTVMALGTAAAAYDRSCRTFALNAAGPGSWGAECPHCQHLNFWKAS